MKLKFSTTKIFIAVVLAFLGLDLWYALVYLPAKEVEKWEAFREELIDRGEKLSIADFVPPKVPDVRNFFADPLWAELYGREPVTNKGMTFHKAKKPSAEWQLDVIQKPFGEAERKALEEEFPAFAPLNGEEKKLVVLRKHWDTAKKSGDTASVAKFVLRALEPSEPVISRLRELGGRPEAYYPLVYQDGPTMSLEHIVPILYASQWLQMHASALLALGRSEEAARDALLIFRLAKALEPEHTLIVALVDMSCVNLAAGIVREGIRDHAWTEAQLVEFDRELARIDIPKRLAGALRMERANWLEATIPLVRKRGVRTIAELAGAKDYTAYQKTVVQPVFWLYCTYWLPGDQIFYSRAIQQWVDALERVPAEGMREESFPDFYGEYKEQNSSYWDTARRIVSLVSLPLLADSFRNGAKRQTEVFQARIAIALERYRMKYGEYPEKLDAVVPEFLTELPLDLMTMEPFLYRREASGKFVLWSVGWDEVDNEGTPTDKSGEGDWVWVE